MGIQWWVRSLLYHSNESHSEALLLLVHTILVAFIRLRRPISKSQKRNAQIRLTVSSF